MTIKDNFGALCIHFKLGLSSRNFDEKLPICNIVSNLVDMRKVVFALVTVLFYIFLIQCVPFLESARAQPPTSDAPRVSTHCYPPISPPNRYENSSVMLEVSVRLLEGSQIPINFSFSLDGSQSMKFEDISTSRMTYWMPHIYTVYIAKITLENLSEGNHTVVVYANDMVNSITFKVNSFYHPTDVKILSPTNQNYSSSVPLVFNVNLPINRAFYYMYRGYDAVFENHFNGNITMSNLEIGNYSLHLYVTTENGVDSASTYFSVINNDGIVLKQIDIAVIILMFVVIVLSLLLYVRHLKKTIKATSSH